MGGVDESGDPENDFVDEDITDVEELLRCPKCRSILADNSKLDDEFLTLKCVSCPYGRVCARPKEGT